MLNIDGVGRELEVQFTLAFRWEDARITQRCIEDGLEDLPSDPCGFFWLPAGETYGIKWPTAKEAPTIIQDFGTFTDIEDTLNPPGCIPAADYAEWVEGQPCTRLPVPVGYTGYVARAVFSVELDYHRFPFDRQELKIKLQAPSSMPRDSIFFVPAAQLNPNLRNAVEGTHNLWRIEDITASTSVVPFVPGQVPEDELRYWMDEVTVTIHLQRRIMNYFGNYILLEVVLCVLGLCTLFIPADSIDGRLGIGLTLVLAMNVFQVVLVENMPSTGYLTDMHWFTIGNTLLLSALCAESIIVYAAVKCQEADNSLRGFLKELLSNSSMQEVEMAAIKLQAATRGLLVRKRLKKVITEAMAEAHRKSQAERSASQSTNGKRRSASVFGKRTTPISSTTPTAAGAPCAAASAADMSAAVDIDAIEAEAVAVQVQAQRPAEAETMPRSNGRTGQAATIVKVVRQGLESSYEAQDATPPPMYEINVRERFHSAAHGRRCMRSLRQWKRRRTQALSYWIANYLDSVSLVLFPAILALIVGNSFEWQYFGAPR